jgi:hypothetical protein
LRIVAAVQFGVDGFQLNAPVAETSILARKRSSEREAAGHEL